MERRNFLKGIFGAAVVASMPPAVVKQIESLPEPPVEWDDVIPSFPRGSVRIDPSNQMVSESVLCIYDKDRLIGYSNDFNLSIHHNFIRFRVDELSDDFYTGPVPLKWDLKVNHIYWYVNPVYLDDTSLHCLILHEEMKLSGDVVISQLASFDPLDKPVWHEAHFEGAGALIIEPDDDTTIKKQT